MVARISLGLLAVVLGFAVVCCFNLGLAVVSGFAVEHW